METLLTSDWPVTISTLTLLGVALIVCLASVLFLHLVKFLINEKAWGKEIINAYKISEFLTKWFVDKEEYSVWKSHSKEYSLVKKDGDWVFFTQTTCCTYYTQLNKEGFIEHDWSDDYLSSLYVTKFKTKQEAEDFIKLPKEEKVEYQVNWDKVRLLFITPVLDISLMFFKMNPIATLSISLTAGLIWGTRWISAKLADNVKMTDVHEEKINKLEEGNKHE